MLDDTMRRQSAKYRIWAVYWDKRPFSLTNKASLKKERRGKPLPRKRDLGDTSTKPMCARVLDPDLQKAITQK